MTSEITEKAVKKAERIMTDLSERELTVISFLCENSGGNIVLISYDNNGLVQFLSEPVSAVSVHQKKGGRCISPIAELHSRNWKQE